MIHGVIYLQTPYSNISGSYCMKLWKSAWAPSRLLPALQPINALVDLAGEVLPEYITLKDVEAMRILACTV